MKIVLTQFLLLLSMTVFAQPVVKSKKEAQKSNLNPTELDKLYPETQELGIGLPASFTGAVRKALDQAMGPEKLEMLVVSSDLYLNKEGRIDYLLYNVRSNMWAAKNGVVFTTTIVINEDSLNHIVNQNLPEQLKDFVSKRHVGQMSKISVSNNFDVVVKPELRSKARVRHDSIVNSFFSRVDKPAGAGVKIVKKDSVIKGLNDALAALDTSKIKELYIENALLVSVPDVIYRFPNLEILSLTDNDIESVNIDMGRLRKLKHINLSGNILSEGNVRISANQSLRLLNLQRNIIKDVPDAVRNCKRLEILWLGRNRLTLLHNKSFRKMRRLKDLNLYKAQLADIPGGIKKLKRLEVLDLYHNDLEVLPVSVTRFRRLTHLAIANNRLSALPERIHKLKRLNVLYAHHNHLSKLPGTIVKLKYLQLLDLGYNWFTDFPAELTAFTNLAELDLSSNNFTDFPEELLRISNLDKLYLRGNPFLTEDKETRYGQRLGLLKDKKIEVFY
jgi:Leucine-rich repeat (LRR) protein